MNYNLDFDTFASPYLVEIVRTWWGIQDIGEWQFKPGGKKTKSVPFSADSRDAFFCGAKEHNTQESCEAEQFRDKPRCSFRGSSCFVNPDVYGTQEWFTEGSMVNSRYKGSVFENIHNIEFDFYGSDEYREQNSGPIIKNIVFLTSIDIPNHVFCLFPTGDAIDIPVEILIKVVGKIKEFAENNTVILCGHSMGGLWAQQTAFYICEKDWSKNVYVVGSGVRKQFNQLQHDKFVQNYRGRFLFLCLTFSDLTLFGKTNIIDNHVFIKMNEDAVALPTVMLSDNPSLITVFIPGQMDMVLFGPITIGPTSFHPSDRAHYWYFYRKYISQIVDGIFPPPNAGSGYLFKKLYNPLGNY